MQLPLSKCLSIAIHSGFLACSTGDIVERANTQGFPSLLFQFAGVGGYAGQDAHQGTLAVDLSLIAAVVVGHCGIDLCKMGLVNIEFLRTL